MIWKFFGAMLIVFGCASFGFRLCAGVKREELALRQLIAALDYIQCELQYRMTPLPDLCRQAGLQQDNRIGEYFCNLSKELDSHMSCDVFNCVKSALDETAELPCRCVKALELLGSTLGRFDAQGQILGLEAVRSHCRSELDALSANQDERLRSYQTLGLCTGAALAILFV